MTGRIIWTEIKLLAREPMTLLMSLLFPVVLLVLLAGAFGTEPSSEFGGIGGVDFYVPVYLAATIAAMGFLGLPTHIAAYRESGVLRRFQAAGMPGRAMLIAQVVVMTLLVAVGAVIMVGLGLGAYELSAADSPIGVAVGLAAGTLAFAAIGALIGSLVSTARAAQGLGLAMFFGLFFIAGGGPPPVLLPDVINTAIDWTPMGPLVDAVSDPWHGAGWNTTALIALFAITVVTGLLAGRRLSRTG